MSRRHLRWLVAVAVAGAAVVLPSAASAETVADCQGKIAALRAQTQTVVIAGSQAEKNRAGLIGKLDQASAKLSEGKRADAIVKLADFKVRVQQLADSGAISPGDAQALLAGADDAIACIESLPA